MDALDVIRLSTQILYSKERNSHSEDLLTFPWVHDDNEDADSIVQTGPPFFARRGAIYHKVARTTRNKIVWNPLLGLI